MTKRQKRELALKRAIIIIIIFTVLTCAIGRAVVVNKNRYAVDAYCEQCGKELYFCFDDNWFSWELTAGDKIPNEKCIVIMDSKGTETLEDDEIVKYK